MKKRLLVLYVRYGSGHKSISEYVANYIEEHNKKFDVKILDITDYGNSLGKFGIKLYDYVCKHRSERIFDATYEILNHKISTFSHNYVAKKSYDNKKIRELICDYNPNVVISSHFFCSNIITLYNKLGLINSKLFTIITDYHTHECWTKNSLYEDGYIVGNEIVKEELIKSGVEAKKIYPFGLPLNLKTLNNLDNKEEIYKRYNLKGNKKVYLFFGGSSIGSVYYYDYLKALCNMQINADIIFICGKNVKLKKKSESLIKRNNILNVKILGYSNDILNIMKISDLVISKPGGATVTECLEMKIPTLILPGLGGQEKYNARFLVKKKYGISVRGIRRFKKTIKKIEDNPNILTKMRERLNKLDSNKSVEKINDLINKL